jgi:hypothetical protein
MTGHTTWHGTQQEFLTLLQAMRRLCDDKAGQGERCTFGPRGQRRRLCAAHAMLLEQRALDGLLWMRRMATRLMREERCLTSQPA